MIAERPTVLVVDDDRNTRETLKRGLTRAGYEILVAEDGSKAVPAAELALLAMTEVVLGPFWVWLVLGETAGLWTLIGGALLLAAIAGNAVSGLRRKPPPIGAV